MCILNKCCFCIELRTGCLIIAYLELIGQIIVAGFTVPAIVAGVWLMEVDNQEAVAAGLTLTILFVATFIFAVILVAFIIGLLIGLYKNNPRPVKMYLIYSVTFTVIRLLMLIIQVTTSCATIEDIAIPILSMLLSVYIMVVIRSYWLKMISVTDNKRKTPAWRKA